MIYDTKNTQTIHHGGDTNWARQMFDYTGADWLDLSTGINASPYPLPQISHRAAHLLPQTSEIGKLLRAARNYYGVNRDGAMAVAPGSQALIQWLPQLCPQGKTVIIDPTYGEHENCWSRCGHLVFSAPGLEEALLQSPDVIVVVNPNNPTGTTYQPDELLEIAKIMHDKGGLLVVDEAFGDVTPPLSMSPHAGVDGLIILKSFGKFFGLAGIRFGIAITNTLWAEKLNNAIGPWAISGITIEIATKAYRDEEWILATQSRLTDDHLRMDNLLKAKGFTIVGGCDLFTLIEGRQAQRLFKRLGNNGIMVRHFPADADWLRFGYPGCADDWQRFETALARF